MHIQTWSFSLGMFTAILAKDSVDGKVLLCQNRQEDKWQRSQLFARITEWTEKGQSELIPLLLLLFSFFLLFLKFELVCLLYSLPPPLSFRLAKVFSSHFSPLPDILIS